MIEDAYHEAFAEAVSRGGSLLTAHKEAIIAAGMLLSALIGLEDEEAKTSVIALNLRPLTGRE